MEVLLGLLAIGIAKGSLLALLAVSFGVVFFTTGTFHIAHGAVFAVTAYCFYLFFSILELPLVAAIVFSFFVSVLFGSLIEILVYKPLTNLYASSTILLLASLAILITAPSLLAIFFTANPLLYPPFPLRSVEVNGICLSGSQVTMVGSWIFIGLLFLVLHRTGIGKLMRAVADRERVALVVGIDVSRVKIIAIVVGSILLTPAAILWGYDVGINPTMGFNVILLASACAIMGGVGNLLGAALSGVIIGITMRVGVTFISSLWAEGIAFLVLVLILLFRPEGILSLRKK